MHLEIKKISKYFETNKVLNNLSYKFQSSTKYGIVGPNGSGKTTLLKIIADLILPSSGEIYINGIKNKHRKINISYIDNNPRSFLMRLSCIENLYYFAAINDVNIKDTNNFINNYFSFVKEDNFLQKPVNSISLGQTHILNIIRGLISSPKIILFDEFSANLDEENITKIISSLNKFIVDNGESIQIFCSPKKSFLTPFINEIFEL